MTELEGAWLAGIIEGEGCLSLHQSKRKYHNSPCPCVSITMCDKDVLDRVVGLVGKKVTGPYGKRLDRKPHYRVSVWGRDAIKVLQIIRQWLGARRADKADQLLKWQYVGRGKRPKK